MNFRKCLKHRLLVELHRRDGCSVGDAEWTQIHKDSLVAVRRAMLALERHGWISLHRESWGKSHKYFYAFLTSKASTWLEMIDDTAGQP
jgi:hypothetical protein